MQGDDGTFCSHALGGVAASGGGRDRDSCAFNLTNQAAAVHASSLLLVGMCDREGSAAGKGADGDSTRKTGGVQGGGAVDGPEQDLCTRLQNAASRGQQRLEEAVRGLTVVTGVKGATNNLQTNPADDAERALALRLEDLLANPAVPLFYL